jgi:adenylylsulfate kinase
MSDNNIIRYKGDITRQHRNRLNSHKSGVVWFTGLPSSGKSTIAHGIERELIRLGIRAYVLDGDNIRHGLNSDLTFSRKDRRENLRRIAEVSRLFIDAGIIVLAAFISPFKEDRNLVKEIVGDDFFEVYVRCSLEECERRDPKGQYKKARTGIIKDYTGISAPYEESRNPDLVIDTEKVKIVESVNSVMELLKERKIFLL